MEDKKIDDLIREKAREKCVKAYRKFSEDLIGVGGEYPISSSALISLNKTRGPFEGVFDKLRRNISEENEFWTSFRDRFLPDYIKEETTIFYRKVENL